MSDQLTLFDLCDTPLSDIKVSDLKAALDTLGLTYKKGKGQKGKGGKGQKGKGGKGQKGHAYKAQLRKLLEPWCPILKFLRNNPEILQYNLQLVPGVVLPNQIALPITQQESEEILQDQTPGSYVLRTSSRGLYDPQGRPVAVLSYVHTDGTIHHMRFRVEDTGRVQMFGDDGDDANDDNDDNNRAGSLLMLVPMISPTSPLNSRINLGLTVFPGEKIKEEIRALIRLVVGSKISTRDLTRQWFDLGRMKRSSDLMERRFSENTEFKTLEATQRQYCADLQSNMYVPELRGIARAFGLPGYSKMKKGELCDAISQFLVLSQGTGYNVEAVLDLMTLNPNSN